MQEVVLILGQQLVVLSLAYRYSKGTPSWRPAVAFTALAVFAGLASTGGHGLKILAMVCWVQR